MANGKADGSSDSVLLTGPAIRFEKWESLKWAARALRGELVDFWKEYPFDLVLEAGPKTSLHYYAFSDRLSWSLMELDSKGIPQCVGRVFGPTYSPYYIAWYGLIKLQEYLRGLNQNGLEVFLKQVEWLSHSYLEDGDGTLIFPLLFDWQECDCFVKAPWPSAIAQGMTMSALIRGYRITGKNELLELSKRAATAFTKDIEAGGLRCRVDGHVYYAEFPGRPIPRILDGFLTGLLGLYDLYVETGDQYAFSLLKQGIDGLKGLLPYWDYRGKWTWYGSRFYLCPRQYHTQNQKLLHCLARLCGDRTLKTFADQWDCRRLSPFDRLEIFVLFLMTKNACRIRYRTWKQRTLARVRPGRKSLHADAFASPQHDLTMDPLQ